MSHDAPSPAGRAPLGALEHAARVAWWFCALVALSLWLEVKGHVWCLWPTRKGSDERVRRSNDIVREWGVGLTELVYSVLQAHLTMRGAVPPGRYIVVSNHQSTADIAILIWALRPLECKFVAKAQLGWGLPSVSTALARMGGALISRRASRRDIERLRRMAAELEGWRGSAVLFAEGTRSRDGRLKPYRSAAVRIIAREARLPLLPVALDGTHAAADLPGFMRNMPRLRAMLAVGEPIPVERWDGRLDETLEEIRRWAGDVIERERAAGTVVPPPDWRPGTILVEDPESASRTTATE